MVFTNVTATVTNISYNSANFSATVIFNTGGIGDGSTLEFSYRLLTVGGQLIAGKGQNQTVQDGSGILIQENIPSTPDPILLNIIGKNLGVTATLFNDTIQIPFTGGQTGGAPDNPSLTVSGITDTEAFATWTIPNDNGSPLTKFNVLVTRTSDTQIVMNQDLAPTATTSILPFLDPSTTYNVLITVFNAIGIGAVGQNFTTIATPLSNWDVLITAENGNQLSGIVKQSQFDALQDPITGLTKFNATMTFTQTATASSV